VAAVAGGRLRDLPHECARVEQELDEQRVAASLEPLFEDAGAQAQRRARDLHDGRLERDVVAQQDGDADHPVAADERDLDGRPVPHVRDQRDDGPFGEVDVLDGVARLIQRLAVRQLDGFEVRAQARVLAARQRRQYVVPDGNRFFGHGLIFQFRSDSARVGFGRHSRRALGEFEQEGEDGRVEGGDESDVQPADGPVAALGAAHPQPAQPTQAALAVAHHAPRTARP
jgi:hypothetical protein